VRLGACLSLSGKYARFGSQAARALGVWQAMDGSVELVLEDDESDPGRLEALLPQLASRCDLLLGPYSTRLMKTAGRIAASNGWLLWNQGGSGDDVEVANPGHVVSVLAPTSRYSKPFLRYLAADCTQTSLCIVHGTGSFGRQVAAGAALVAAQLGIDATQIGPDDDLPSVASSADWDFFSVGRFEQDVDLVKRAQALAHPPRTVCAVAAGVRAFGEVIENAENIFGLAQWFPGSAEIPALGPTEVDFLSAYAKVSKVTPDYPAVQAVAGGVIAAHCARQAGATTREALWSAAAELDTTTLFGGFRIDPVTGAQVKHETVLVRWTADRGPMRV
jgi:ABC-type branched-subunit amino acid transport system substrate-binding protein